MTADITEFTIGVLADDETTERMRLALLALLESAEFDPLPWTFTVSHDPDLRGPYQHLLDEAAIRAAGMDGPARSA
ncbi:hypothetical protein GSU69_15405 [Rathayibacter festucae]|uniref:Uncharacterized protein n=1 Tax=Rathayibacter festucae TaxID=110937 RepID=A0ABX6H2C6_9MICO|nr:hypothetical protein [Rathayibacter festucae]QHC63931.1 hypothetical protein GSU69_15405 [Rathayibacter festucae]